MMFWNYLMCSSSGRGVKEALTTLLKLTACGSSDTFWSQMMLLLMSFMNWNAKLWGWACSARSGRVLPSWIASYIYVTSLASKGILVCPLLCMSLHCFNIQSYNIKTVIWKAHETNRPKSMKIGVINRRRPEGRFPRGCRVTTWLKRLGMSSQS